MFTVDQLLWSLITIIMTNVSTQHDTVQGITKHDVNTPTYLKQLST